MSFDFPSPATAGQTFSPPGGPQYVFTNGTWRMQGAPYQSSLQDTASDMSIGFRTAGNRFVVNSGPALDGTDVMQVSEAGAVTTAGAVQTATGGFISNQNYQSSTTTLLMATTGAGTFRLRPNGAASGTGETTIDSAGTVTATGAFVSPWFSGAGASVVLGTNSAGTISLRPNGIGSTTGQTTISSTGDMVTAGGHSTGAYSATGASAGWMTGSGQSNSSNTGTAAFSQYRFYNANGMVGYIQTSASATVYSTSSDARLKTFKSNYDPQEAIAIIRADPVKSFAWKADDTEAVGWFAQDSYAVDKNLANPPPEDDKDGRWGIDYGRRTPYLWAALTHALDRIESLEARIAALEAA